MNEDALGQRNETEVNNLAIIPFQPTLQVVLISIWAQSRDFQHAAQSVPQTEDNQVPNLDHNLNVYELHQPDLQSVTLPVEVSLSNPNTPLEVSSCRRSSRLSAIKDKVFYELEANPRKKQRVWRVVGEKSNTSLQVLNNPPKPTDEVIPRPIPQEFLKSWGILCDVSPEELTDEALLAEKTTEVPNDRTSN